VSGKFFFGLFDERRHGRRILAARILARAEHVE